MQEEYESLMTNNTWTLVPLLAGRKPISCKWVLQIKQGANGEVERYKPAKVKLQRNANGNDESKEFPYQQVVGSLMYAMLCT